MSEQNLQNQVAVISAGGKQHLARIGEKFAVNQVTQAEGLTITATNELTKQPVQLKVVKHFLGEKVNGLKFKNKVRYLKRYGHRQPLTLLELVSFGEPKKAEAKAKATTKTVKPTPKKVKNG